MVDEKETSSVKVTEPVAVEPENEGVQLSRKRTREDFEEGEEEKDDDPSERKIAPIKRRKDTIEVTEGDSNSKTKVEESPEVAIKTTENEKKDDKKEIGAKESSPETTTTKEPKESSQEETNDDDKDDDKDEAKDEAKNEAKDEVKDETKDQNKDQKNVEKNTEQKDEKPAFVFGSTTPFGANAFSIMNKNKNVFSSSSSNEASKSPSASTPSVFGSNSKFGNAFQSAITKESIFDKAPEKQTEEEKELEKSKESTPLAGGNLYKQVDLEKKEVKSGEEDEEHVFTCRAKLYALDLSNVKEGWKERGVGNVHVNKAKDGARARVIMRSIGLLKVVLNTPLIEGLEVVKGMPSSLASEKFIRITVVENSKPVQYALKTGNPETATNLYESIVELISKN